MRITILVENTAGQANVLGEHGLSYWIELPESRILFDAGRAISFEHNVRALNIRLEQADAIALSHGHYDHTGGLALAMRRAPKARVFLHPDALRRRFSLRGGTPHAIGIHADARAELDADPQRLVWTEQPMELAKGVFVSGPALRTNDYEDTGGPFFLDSTGTQPDLIMDDQSIWIETDRGLVVLLGCSHSGVVNIIEYILSRTNVRPLLAVIGGMHLGAASPRRLELTVAAMRKFQPLQLAPMHCTGLPAVMALTNALPGRCVNLSAGVTIEF